MSSSSGRTLSCDCSSSRSSRECFFDAFDPIEYGVQAGGKGPHPLARALAGACPPMAYDFEKETDSPEEKQFAAPLEKAVGFTHTLDLRQLEGNFRLSLPQQHDEQQEEPPAVCLQTGRLALLSASVWESGGGPRCNEFVVPLRKECAAVEAAKGAVGVSPERAAASDGLRERGGAAFQGGSNCSNCSCSSAYWCHPSGGGSRCSLVDLVGAVPQQLDANVCGEASELLREPGFAAGRQQQDSCGSNTFAASPMEAPVMSSSSSSSSSSSNRARSAERRHLSVRVQTIDVELGDVSLSRLQLAAFGSIPRKADAFAPAPGAAAWVLAVSSPCLPAGRFALLLRLAYSQRPPLLTSSSVTAGERFALMSASKPAVLQHMHARQMRSSDGKALRVKATLEGDSVELPFAATKAAAALARGGGGGDSSVAFSAAVAGGHRGALRSAAASASPGWHAGAFAAAGDAGNADAAASRSSRPLGFLESILEIPLRGSASHGWVTVVAEGFELHIGSLPVSDKGSFFVGSPPPLAAGGIARLYVPLTHQNAESQASVRLEFTPHQQQQHHQQQQQLRSPDPCEQCGDAETELSGLRLSVDAARVSLLGAWSCGFCLALMEASKSLHGSARMARDAGAALATRGPRRVLTSIRRLLRSAHLGAFQVQIYRLVLLAAPGDTVSRGSSSLQNCRCCCSCCCGSSSSSCTTEAGEEGGGWVIVAAAAASCSVKLTREGQLLAMRSSVEDLRVLAAAAAAAHAPLEQPNQWPRRQAKTAADACSNGELTIYQILCGASGPPKVSEMPRFLPRNALGFGGSWKKAFFFPLPSVGAPGRPFGDAFLPVCHPDRQNGGAGLQRRQPSVQAAAAGPSSQRAALSAAAAASESGAAAAAAAAAAPRRQSLQCLVVIPEVHVLLLPAGAAAKLKRLLADFAAAFREVEASVAAASSCLIETPPGSLSSCASASILSLGTSFAEGPLELSEAGTGVDGGAANAAANGAIAQYSQGASLEEFSSSGRDEGRNGGVRDAGGGRTAAAGLSSSDRDSSDASSVSSDDHGEAFSESSIKSSGSQRTALRKLELWLGRLLPALRLDAEVRKCVALGGALAIPPSPLALVAAGTPAARSDLETGAHKHGRRNAYLVCLPAFTALRLSRLAQSFPSQRYCLVRLAQAQEQVQEHAQEQVPELHGARFVEKGPFVGDSKEHPDCLRPTCIAPSGASYTREGGGEEVTETGYPWMLQQQQEEERQRGGQVQVCVLVSLADLSVHPVVESPITFSFILTSRRKGGLAGQEQQMLPQHQTLQEQQQQKHCECRLEAFLSPVLLLLTAADVFTLRAVARSYLAASAISREAAASRLCCRCKRRTAVQMPSKKASFEVLGAAGSAAAGAAGGALSAETGACAASESLRSGSPWSYGPPEEGGEGDDDALQLAAPEACITWKVSLEGDALQLTAAASPALDALIRLSCTEASGQAVRSSAEPQDTVVSLQLKRVSIQVAEMRGASLVGSCVLHHQQQQPARPWQQQQWHHHQQQQTVLLPLLLPVSVAAALQPCKEPAPSVSVRIDGDVDLKANPKHFPAFKRLATQFADLSASTSSCEALYIHPHLSAEALRLVFAMSPYTPHLPAHATQHRAFGIPYHMSSWSGAYRGAFAPAGTAAAELRQPQQQVLWRHQQPLTEEQRTDTSDSEQEASLGSFAGDATGAADADAAGCCGASVSSLSETEAAQDETNGLSQTSYGVLYDRRQLPSYSLPVYRQDCLWLRNSSCHSLAFRVVGSRGGGSRKWQTGILPPGCEALLKQHQQQLSIHLAVLDAVHPVGRVVYLPALNQGAPLFVDLCPPAQQQQQPLRGGGVVGACASRHASASACAHSLGGISRESTEYDGGPSLAAAPSGSLSLGGPLSEGLRAKEFGDLTVLALQEGGQRIVDVGCPLRVRSLLKLPVELIFLAETDSTAVRLLLTAALKSAARIAWLSASHARLGVTERMHVGLVAS
ncbi:LOW QUALITY PROTEIN: uncharacterized protein LOC34624648 [Cyclospora cayetanensis]|uniref:LOW QUALITY PROTEIN: uncharacterized protein LOC34624648 n=1 Tax=Cyclospora cayetanensis TaxID=88456 RepID=A0A6P6S145_9EIME|nr:LOW QUALITY PROTEIN: uncharacterized protein LOC34624648 [Cyclospora cayetanensis]